jgi:large repetitive protein
MGSGTYKRTTRSARRFLLAALLGVFGLGGWGTYAVFAASSPPPAPTITVKPLNPSNSPTPSFSYTDTQSVTNFQCSIDGSSFVNCGSGTSGSTSFSNVGNGSHTFRVQAFQKQGSLTSGQTSYTWTADLVKPTLSAINRAATSPTNAASVSWTVTFSEQVSGVATSNFVTATTLSGTSVTGVSPSTGSATSFTVTASTGTGTPTGSTLGLNLANGTGIKDAAQNSLATTSFTGQTYVIDKTPPTAVPTITSGPSALVNSSAATFAFTSTEPAFACKLDAGVVSSCTSPKSYTALADGGHTFSVYSVDAAGNVGTTAATRTWTIDTVPPTAPTLTYFPDDPNGDGIANFKWTATDPSILATKCSIENGPFTGCPAQDSYQAHYILDVSNDGTHQFAVAVYDAAGNAGVTTYKWKVLHAVNVVVDGNADGMLYPGGPPQSLKLMLHNPNNFPVTISYINVTVSNSPPGCAAAMNLTLQQSNIGNGSNPQTIPVPANTNLLLPPANRPTVRLLDIGNQDACKNGTFTFSYLAKGSK